jgi:hypothetical protein
MRPQPADISIRAMRELLDHYDVDYVLTTSAYAKSAVLALVAAHPPELRFVRALPTGGVFAPTATRPATPSQH